MANLALTYSNIAAAVGRFLGYGATSSEWTSAQTSEIDECVQSGARRFYYPMPLPGEPKSHQWAFLRPKYSFNTVVNDFDTDMPSDFLSIIERITFDNSESRPGWIEVVDAARIMEAKSLNDVAGTPKMGAIRAKTQTAGSQQGFELILYPKPDAIYTLHFRYAINPEQLSTTNTYPLGGAQHSETLLESCLAVAEERHDDEQRVHAARFMERLAASVSLDRSTGPLNFGYNGDGPGQAPFDEAFYVSYNGTVPS